MDVAEKRNIQGRAVEAEDRRVRFVASREVIDRHGTIVKVDGIDTTNFDKNPVLLWGHDGYGGYAPPDPESVIGKVVSHEVIGRDFIIEAEFTPAGINPRADLVYNLVQAGVIRTVSIGFYPCKETVQTVDGREVIIYEESELLEVSVVPIPSNPDAVAIMRDITESAQVRGVVPRDVSREKAPRGASWAKPTLADFTDSDWAELSAAEKNRIARHYAWAPKLPPEKFTDLKLPHHRPSDGAVVWRGVTAAMAALLGGVQIPGEDRKRVYNHLAAHYRQFNVEPPEFKTYSEAELAAILNPDEGQRDAAPPDGVDIAAFREALREIRKMFEGL